MELPGWKHSLRRRKQWKSAAVSESGRRLPRRCRRCNHKRSRSVLRCSAHSRFSDSALGLMTVSFACPCATHLSVCVIIHTCQQTSHWTTDSSKKPAGSVATRPREEAVTAALGEYVRRRKQLQ